MQLHVTIDALVVRTFAIHFKGLQVFWYFDIWDVSRGNTSDMMSS